MENLFIDKDANIWQIYPKKVSKNFTYYVAISGNKKESIRETTHSRLLNKLKKIGRKGISNPKFKLK